MPFDVDVRGSITGDDWALDAVGLFGKLGRLFRFVNQLGWKSSTYHTSFAAVRTKLLGKSSVIALKAPLF